MSKTILHLTLTVDESVTQEDIGKAFRKHFKVVEPVYTPQQFPPAGFILSNDYPEFYEAKEGDTLSGIAQAHGQITAYLQKLNPCIKDPDLIYAGQFYRVRK